MFKNLKDCLNLSNRIIENAVLKDRVKFLENEIRDVVTQQGDNLCWVDIYTRLAKCIGIEFNPTLLDKETMDRNCERFTRSLREGCQYKINDKEGEQFMMKLISFNCGYCNGMWNIHVSTQLASTFCPFCGKQQSFILRD